MHRRITGMMQPGVASMGSMTYKINLIDFIYLWDTLGMCFHIHMGARMICLGRGCAFADHLQFLWRPASSPVLEMGHMHAMCMPGYQKKHYFFSDLVISLLDSELTLGSD